MGSSSSTVKSSEQHLCSTHFGLVGSFKLKRSISETPLALKLKMKCSRVIAHQYLSAHPCVIIQYISWLNLIFWTDWHLRPLNVWQTSLSFSCHFFTKLCVYAIFVNELIILYQKFDIPFVSSFLGSWKSRRAFTKVRKNSRFTKCPTCEQLTPSLAESLRHLADTEHLKYQMRNHLKFIRYEIF